MTFTVIAISGEVASGKSAIAGELLKLLPDWEYINTGRRFREYCDARGVSIQEVSHIEDNVHIVFDDYQARLMRSGQNLIVEGRLAGWLARNLAHTFRVFCQAPLDVRVQRYQARQKVSRAQALADIRYRDAGDVQKFRAVYGIEDYRTPQLYHLLLDTADRPPEELAREILRAAGIAPASQADQTGF